jgi:hypothetical protein
VKCSSGYVDNDGYTGRSVEAKGSARRRSAAGEKGDQLSVIDDA